MVGDRLRRAAQLQSGLPGTAQLLHPAIDQFLAHPALFRSQTPRHPHLDRGVLRALPKGGMPPSRPSSAGSFAHHSAALQPSSKSNSPQEQRLGGGGGRRQGGGAVKVIDF